MGLFAFSIKQLPIFVVFDIITTKKMMISIERINHMYYTKPLIEQAIGNTPMIQLSSSRPIFAKIEGLNFFGSVKDRAALYIIKHLLNTGKINGRTEIIESSSGNFAISLAGVCKAMGLKFICVSDPLLNPINKSIIECLGANIVIVTKADEHNIYVNSRLHMIENIIRERDNIYWINQYDSLIMLDAYNKLAEEIISERQDVEYVFIPVSSCATIAGVSRALKAYNQNIRVIAVDLESSSIFYTARTNQHLPGMGFYKKPGNLQYAKIDDIVIVSEIEGIRECRNLLKRGVFVGASSGCTMAAIKKYSDFITSVKPIVAIFPDRGERYITTIYNDDWCNTNFPGFNSTLKS